MSYNTRNILRDVNLIPVPQHFNETADEYQVTQGRKGATFVQLRGMSAKEPFEGTATTVQVFTQEMYGFVISNDGTDDLTFTIGNDTFRVRSGEVWDDFIEPFLEVTVTTTGPFRAYGRG